MKKTDEKKIEALAYRLREIGAELSAAVDHLQSVAEAERVRYDNMSERRQQSDKGVTLGEVVESLESAYSEAATAVVSAFNAAQSIVDAMAVAE
jgi:hypothetical protein